MFISELHTDLRLSLSIKRGRQNIDPSKLPKGMCKEYLRMDRAFLPAPQFVEKSLSDVMRNRRSYEMGEEKGNLTFSEWGTLLGTSIGNADEKSRGRNYPSGGSFYPVETYVIASTDDSNALTVFHYDPNVHALEKLWAVPNEIDFQNVVVVEPPIAFSAMLIFTAVWRRSSAKYGDFAYNLALMEAGHMAQNLQLVATAMGLKSRPLAGFVDEAVNTMLDIDTDEEQAVYSMIISR